MHAVVGKNSGTEETMEKYEARYRGSIQSTPNLIVTFFERPDEFADAMEDLRRQIELANIEPDRSCILYRTRCISEAMPRLRVWSQLVPFQALTLPDDPRPPWVGLDRDLKRPMTDDECRTFFREKRYDILEIRVSKREPQSGVRSVVLGPVSSFSGASSVSSSSRGNGYLEEASTVTVSSGMDATRSRKR
jgi:hypothetical protein